MGGRRTSGGDSPVKKRHLDRQARCWTFLHWVLAGIFLYAALMKLHDAAAFAASIARFQMLPSFLIHPMALGLPPLEMLCGLALLAGRWKRQAAFGIALLCALFLVALLSASARGISIECSCFGAAAAEPLWKLLVRDLLLLAGAMGIYLRALGYPASSPGTKCA
ncbi:MAG: hypothetical protein JWL59_3271 [Chthoniobacteraceae bacterium]|nr:hypothetical protein [Chthoniobacteraceae bacterium]